MGILFAEGESLLELWQRRIGTTQAAREDFEGRVAQLSAGLAVASLYPEFKRPDTGESGESGPQTRADRMIAAGAALANLAAPIEYNQNARS